jgi:hypothetical protein
MSHKYSVYTNHGGYNERWWGTFPARNLALLLGYTLVCFCLATVLTRRRFAR